MAGSIDRRIQQLEELYAMDESPDEEKARRRAELEALRESLHCARERAEAEAAAGDARRLRAVQELEEWIQPVEGR